MTRYYLQMYLKVSAISVLKYMSLIQLIFYQHQDQHAYKRQPCLQKTKVKLELLNDIDMLLMVEKEIRSGICHAIHRYGKQTINTEKIAIKIVVYHVLGCQQSINMEYVSKNT